MSTQRYTVLGLAPVRAEWFREVTAWSMAGVVPVDFVKCVSLEEVRARLRSGRSHSAMLVDAETPGVDRDLFAGAHEWDCAVLVVDGGGLRDWTTIGADAVIEPGFGREALLEALHHHAPSIAPSELLEIAGPPLADAGPAPWSGSLIAVSGRTGSGVSTLAAALAQELADDARNGGLVALVDLALDADQAVLHDAVDVVPGLQELVDAHRVGRPSAEQVRAATFDIAARGYDLLLGLRRHRDWVTLRPRAVDATLEGLRKSYRMIVADCEADLEGEEQTGSVDVEERNVAARAAVAQADMVIAVGTNGLVGVHGLVRHLDALLAAGVVPERIIPVVNRAPRSRRQRAELSRTVGELVDSPERERLPTPVYVLERSGVDEIHRAVGRLPGPLGSVLHGAVRALIERPTASAGATRRVPVIPGSLGALSPNLGTER